VLLISRIAKTKYLSDVMFQVVFAQSHKVMVICSYARWTNRIFLFLFQIPDEEMMSWVTNWRQWWWNGWY